MASQPESQFHNHKDMNPVNNHTSLEEDCELQRGTAAPGWAQTVVFEDQRGMGQPPPALLTQQTDKKQMGKKFLR